MSGNINEVYTIQGSQNHTIDKMRAFMFAKRVAEAKKEKVIIYLNGNPAYLIDRKGNLIAA